MARNGSGTYSLPQPPFTPGTVISSSAVNSNFSDVATALTQSVSSDGQTTITGQLRSSVTATPAYSGTSDTTTGFGVSGAGIAAVFAGGTTIASYTSTGQSITGNSSISGNASITGNLSVTGTQSFSGTGGITIPDGTSGQRPGSPTAGLIRYNSTNNVYEGYDGTEWQKMSSFTTDYTLTATTGSNLLTMTVTNALIGGTPTAADPLSFRVPDATAANGDLVTILATSSLSISTNATGASLGSSNGVPFRLWIAVFNNAGTPELALINCSTATQNYSLPVTGIASTTGISSGATSAGVFYTPNGVNLTNCGYKLLGFLTYETALSTAGTYTTTPDNVRQLYAGTPVPGQIIQRIYATANTPTSTTSNTKTATNTTASVTPTSKANLILVRATGSIQNSGNTDTAAAQLSRGSGPTLIGALATAAAIVGTGGASGTTGVTLEALDAPATASSQAYTVYAWSPSSTGSVWLPSISGTQSISTIIIEEIMG